MDVPIHSNTCTNYQNSKCLVPIKLVGINNCLLGVWAWRIQESQKTHHLSFVPIILQIHLGDGYTTNSHFPVFLHISFLSSECYAGAFGGLEFCSSWFVTKSTFCALNVMIKWEEVYQKNSRIKRRPLQHEIMLVTSKQKTPKCSIYYSPTCS